MSDALRIWNQSVISSVIKPVGRWYRYIEEKTTGIYNYSQTHELVKGAKGIVKICARYSFLGRITEIEEKNNQVILDNSKFIKRLIEKYKVWEGIIVRYFGISAINNSLGAVKKELYFSPLKTGGIILATGISTNIFFSILLNKGVGLFGWFMRLALLFVGISGLFSNVNWLTLKNNSIIFKIVFKNKCVEFAER